MSHPAISVVMAVRDGASTLPAAIESILAQSESNLELIIIDDGSGDDTRAIAEGWAYRDSRIRLLSQENRGLTASLVRGCEIAQAPLIARQDADDRSLPDRLLQQRAVMQDPQVVLASCWTRWIGPDGEHLYDVRADGEEVRRSLLGDGVDSIRGLPGHGTAMFRRSDYVAVGGYRTAFRYAQDLDLWIRLAPRGRIAFVPEVLYEYRFAPGSITANWREAQVSLARIAIAIRDGGDEEKLLARAAEIQSSAAPANRRVRSRGLYFIASCLRRNGDERFRRYAREAVAADPLNLRAWLLLLR